MKELSIEDKAKRYDEVLEKINELLYVSDKDSLQRKTVEHIFPELKESEDERIRKELIDFLEYYRLNNVLDSKTIFLLTDSVAWLEKQSGKELVTCPICGWEIEKQCEQKPVVDTKVIIPKFRVGDIVKSKSQPMLSPRKIISIGKDCYWCEDRGCIGFAWEDDCEIVEQNPAWSEEDEDNFKHLLDEIVCLGNNRNSANRLYYDRLIKFIEELKNRAQPKEKWCDKDERMLDRLIAYFEKQVAFTDDDNPRYANWLKSLRPQSQWKPSEKQIETLEAWLRDNRYKGDARYCYPIFDSLYEQLKKLREE